nr:MAG TPA: hypothetical protein [Caudoviricetes sp.]
MIFPSDDGYADYRCGGAGSAPHPPRPVPHPRAYVADRKRMGCVTPRKVVIEENKQTS